jgi:serine protease
MKRTAVVVFAFLATLSIHADEAQRYLVATRGPVLDRIAEGMVRATQAEDRRVGGTRAFRSVNGFAADLTASEAAALRRSPGVRFVEPVVERHAFDLRSYPGQTTPYGVGLVQAPATWAATRSAVVNVVVADSGVDYTHPDLSALWAGGTNTITASGPMDDHGHGTHVAGIIAAENNAIGVVGVTGGTGIHLWGVKVLKKTVDGKASGTSESLIKALDWIIQKKKDLGGSWVVNLSLGSNAASALEQEAFNRAIAAGIVIVAATGNDSTPDVIAPVSYPAAYSGVIGVGAIDSHEAIADFSNQGPEVDVAAPGVDILSTVPIGTGYAAFVESPAKTYSSSPLTGSKRGTISGPFVYCGMGREGEVPASVNGKIALIKRGEIRFAEKTKRAKEAGATAVVIFNNDTSAMNWTLVNADDPSAATYDWPVTLAITLADGEALLQQASAPITLSHVADDYGEMTGTSMASPHVAGALALLWSVAPDATPGTLFTAITTTALDLGAPGKDTVFGFGAIDVHAAAKQLAPGAFNEPPAPARPTTGRPFLRRGRG